MLGIYIRVSSLKQANKGKSLPAQEKLGISKAKQLKMKFELYVEPGEGASSESLDNRPVIQQLLADCENGKITSIYVTDEDRLSRNMVTKLLIKKTLSENDVKIYSSSGIVDFNDADSALFSDLKTLLAQHETSILSKRIKRVLKSNVQSGGVGTGASIPFGFKNVNKKMVIDEINQLIVVEIFNLSILGYGTRHIANKLNEERKLSPKGKLWRDGTVYGILKNTAYIGKRYWQGEYFDCPAIVDETLFRKAQQSLKKRAENIKNGRKYDYLLNDFLECGVCGKPMRGRRNLSDGSNIYKCTSARNTGGACINKSINRPRIEKIIEFLLNYKKGNRSLVGLVVSEEQKGGSKKNDLVEAMNEFDAMTARKQEVMDSFADGFIKKRDWQTLMITIGNKQDKLESTIESLKIAIAFEDNDELKLTKFDSLNFDEKRSTLIKLFSHATIVYQQNLNYWRVTFYSNSLKKLIRLNVNEKGVFNAFVYSDGIVDIVPTISGQSDKI